MFAFTSSRQLEHDELRSKKYKSRCIVAEHTKRFILALLFTNHRVVFHTNNRAPTSARPARRAAHPPPHSSRQFGAGFSSARCPGCGGSGRCPGRTNSPNDLPGRVQGRLCSAYLLLGTCTFPFIARFTLAIQFFQKKQHIDTHYGR